MNWVKKACLYIAALALLGGTLLPPASECRGAEPVQKAGNIIRALQVDPGSPEHIKEALEAGREDPSLLLFASRRLSRDYPFSYSLATLLERARSGGDLEGLPGVDISSYLLSLPLLRLVTIIALVSHIARRRRLSLLIFGGGLILCLFGEALNFKRGLSRPVFIPVAGDHFALSAPLRDAVAVEKLTPGMELLIGEFRGDWIQLNLSSGRIGWIRSDEGLIDEG